MIELDWKEIGTNQEITLEHDLLLDDCDFSKKAPQIARKGDKIKMMHKEDYGVVIHPEYGIFRC